MKPRLRVVGHYPHQYWRVNINGVPRGVVTTLKHKGDKYTAYLAIPVCPLINWTETHPRKESRRSGSQAKLFYWLFTEGKAK